MVIAADGTGIGGHNPWLSLIAATVFAGVLLAVVFWLMRRANMSVTASAKASESAKPRVSPSGPRPGAGIVEVDPDRIREFLHPLPVGAVWGVGPSTLAKLQRLGVATVGDLARLPPETLERSLGGAAEIGRAHV